jgi:hypothetical protein
MDHELSVFLGAVVVTLITTIGAIIVEGKRGRDKTQTSRDRLEDVIQLIQEIQTEQIDNNQRLDRHLRDYTLHSHRRHWYPFKE